MSSLPTSPSNQHIAASRERLVSGFAECLLDQAFNIAFLAQLRYALPVMWKSPAQLSQVLMQHRNSGCSSLSSSDSCPEPQGCFPAQNSAQLLCSSISSSLSEDPSLPWPCLESSFPALPRLPIQQLHLRNFAQRSYSPNNRRLQPYGELSAMKQSNKM